MVRRLTAVVSMSGKVGATLLQKAAVLRETGEAFDSNAVHLLCYWPTYTRGG